MLQFLDVSNWNDIQRFDGIKEKYGGVICKATEGATYIDPTFEWKVRNLKANGVRVGSYHFLRSTSTPEQQAQNFYNVISKFELDFLPVLDVEESGCTEEMCVRFINEFKKYSDTDVVIYTGEYFGNTTFSTSFKKEHLFWIAKYSNNPPKFDGKIIAWQYSENGVIDGIKGAVDMNYFYDEEAFLGNDLPFVSEGSSEEFDENYEEHGVATVKVNGLRIRRYPSTNGKVVGTYNIGDKFVYEWVFVNDGYVWCRYVGNSGEYCFVAVRRLNDNRRYATCI